MKRNCYTGIAILIATIAIVGTLLIVENKNKPEAISTSTPYNEALTKIANDKLDDLVATGYWEHTNSNGCDYHCRIRQYLGNDMYSWVGENLYKGVCSVQHAYSLWEKSPSHKAVLDHEYNTEVLLSRQFNEEECYIILERAVLNK